MQRQPLNQPTEHLYTLMMSIFGREGMLDKVRVLISTRFRPLFRSLFLRHIESECACYNCIKQWISLLGTESLFCRVVLLYAAFLSESSPGKVAFLPFLVYGLRCNPVWLPKSSVANPIGKLTTAMNEEGRAWGFLTSQSRFASWCSWNNFTVVAIKGVLEVFKIVVNEYHVSRAEEQCFEAIMGSHFPAPRSSSRFLVSTNRLEPGRSSAPSHTTFAGCDHLWMWP